MTELELKQLLSRITRPDETARTAAHAHWASLAKPLGGLGRLETMLEDAAALTGTAELAFSRRAVLVLCADNGVVAQGVSQTDQSVTRAVAENLAARRTSVCQMAKTARCEVVPVDLGMAGEPVPGVQYQEAFESLVRFCQGGGPEDEERTGTGSSSDPQDEPVLDYRCDSDYIVGAFQQAYGIDLTADKVHWGRFKALLHALPPETPLGKIVEIRGKDTSSMDRADRDYYETLKERFALPDGLKGVKRNETLQEHEDAFLDRFG